LGTGQFGNVSFWDTEFSGRSSAEKNFQAMIKFVLTPTGLICTAKLILIQIFQLNIIPKCSSPPLKSSKKTYLNMELLYFWQTLTNKFNLK
jgi:hypothetical protein